MTTSTNRTRAVLYARVSKLDIEDPRIQLTVLREFCAARGFTVVMEATDRINGSVVKRPGLDQALTALRIGAGDVLIAYSVDRLGRSIPHLFSVIAQIREWNRGVVLVREGLDLGQSSPSADLLFNVMSSLAQLEKSLVSERTKCALRTAKLCGVRLGRPSKISPEIETKILQMRSDGIAIREIARKLSEVSRGTIQGILRRAKR